MEKIMENSIIEKKNRAFGICLSADVVDRMDEECKRLRVSRTQYILSLFENRNDPSPRRPNESSGQDLSGFKTDVIECLRSGIESLRDEIRSALAVRSSSSPPDLSPVLAAIGNLTCRVGEMGGLSSGKTSEAPVDLSPLVVRLDEILELLQSGPPSRETESDVQAISFLSLQMGEIVQGIERLAGQMDAVVRGGKNNGGGTSTEIKDELIRLAESVEQQSALTGEILRIGDTVREIRERLLKNVPQGQTEGPVVPKKISRKEVRSIEPDPAAEKKRETRQFGWAVGILLVFMMGFMGWEMLGWYNGGDSTAPSAISSPKTSPGILTPGAPKQAR